MKKTTFFIALILVIAVPSSTSETEKRIRSERSDDTEQYLRDICSETDNSDVCWNLIEPELHRFDKTDDEEIIDGVIDLAREKSKEVQEQLDNWYKDSKDDKLKKKYHSCSKNYKNIEHDLEKVQKILDSDDYDKIWDKIDNAGEKLDKCRKEFEEGSFDPGYVEDRNNELKVYLDLVRVAAGDLEDSNHEDRE